MTDSSSPASTSSGKARKLVGLMRDNQEDPENTSPGPVPASPSDQVATPIAETESVITEVLPALATGPAAKKSAEAQVKRWKPETPITPAKEERLRKNAIEVRILHRINAFLIVELGSRLMQAKEDIGRGNFIEYCETACGLGIKTAQNYMKAASVFGDNPKLISKFSPKTIYRLAFAAAKIPREKFDEVISLPTDESVHEELQKIMDPITPAASSPEAHFLAYRTCIHQVERLQKSFAALPENVRTELEKSLAQIKATVSQFAPPTEHEDEPKTVGNL